MVEFGFASDVRDTVQDCRENRDKNETRIGHGHRCPSESDSHLGKTKTILDGFLLIMNVNVQFQTCLYIQKDVCNKKR